MKYETRKMKNSNDYPVISFRINENDKNEILEKISKIKTSINSESPDDHYRKKSKEIFFEALNIGLTKMLKRYDNEKGN